MAGYIGYSRSVNSQESIDSFETPISLISRILIDDFLSENDGNFTEEEIAILEKTAVVKWKFVASECIRPFSWHHTSKFYNETDHYSLYRIAVYILEHIDNLNEAYKVYREAKKLTPAEISAKKAIKEEKEQAKIELEEKTKLFKYQKQYKTLGGFLRSTGIDLNQLREKRAQAIINKRNELNALWEKQLPKDHWNWKSINDDKFIESYIK